MKKDYIYKMSQLLFKNLVMLTICYLFSPKLCIGAAKIRLNGDMIQIDSKVYNLTDEEKREINYSSVQNASNIVIVQRKENFLVIFLISLKLPTSSLQ